MGLAGHRAKNPYLYPLPTQDTPTHTVAYRRVLDTTSWGSVWTSSGGFLARNSVNLKGFACILPVQQGSQTGSGAVFEVISIPMTKWWSSSFLTPLWWW